MKNAEETVETTAILSEINISDDLVNWFKIRAGKIVGCRGTVPKLKNLLIYTKEKIFLNENDALRELEKLRK